jgi:long-subunit acyl-CoA synthetase (AMP-forming)
MSTATLCEAFQHTAAANGGRPALRAADSGETITWDEYARRVRAIATGLHGLGVRPGDPVGILLRNRPAFNLADTAALHLGATPFSLYATEPLEQMVALMQDSGARVLITEEEFSERGAAVAETSVSVAELEDLRDDAFDFEAAWRAVTPESIACLIYTSGTTGKPKAVQLPHRAIMHSLAGVEALAPRSMEHRGVSFLPNAHISDRFICHYSTLGIGGTLTGVPEHERLWDTLREVRPTRFHGVPRTFEKLADFARAQIEADPELSAALEASLAAVRAGRRDPEADETLLPVREQLGLDQVEWLSVAAAPSAYAVLEFHHAIGINLAEVWGMSEFMMAIMNPPSRVKLGTVGVPLPAVEARLADDGELLLRGPHACAGYRGDAEKTAAMLDGDGWVHSGDLAAIDDDGYFRIVGRKKEVMINSSGKNLFPAKIEAAVKESSRLVAHVAVIADRRRYVSALIVPDREQLASFEQPEAEIERAVTEANTRLSRVEHIRAFRILDDDWAPGGPVLTNTMKLRRASIAERYADLIEEMYA